jgi:hypothetical protein
MAAEQVDQEVMGTKVTFPNGRVGRIDKLWNEGNAQLKDCTWYIKATMDDPVVRVKLPDGRHVLRWISDLAGAISQ